MPSDLTYPGVYIEEVPSGVRTIVGVSTSIAAFVGRTPRGPTDRPVTITSFADYERIFGGDAERAGGGLDNNYPLGFSVRDFYLNGGSVAIICRAVKGASTAEIAAHGVTLAASSPGDWANKLRIRITKPADADAQAAADRLGVAKTEIFNLSIRDMRAGGDTETFTNLTAVPSARQITGVLAAQSNLVRTQVGWVPAAPSGVHAATTPDKFWENPNSTATSTPGTKSAALGPAADFGATTPVSGLYLLTKADLFNLLVIPPDTLGEHVPQGVHSAAATLCHEKRALYIVDPPKTWTSQSAVNVGDIAIGAHPQHAALYFPRVVEANPLFGDQPGVFAPSGAIAGVMARTDVSRGVWKAPAGIDAALSGVTALDVLLNDIENGLLNQRGVNCLRTFPVYGNIVWGARTMAGDDQRADEYKYVPVRRLANFIEESLFRGLKWVVFEPNDEPLWGQIRLNVGAFMQDLFRQGAFQGTSPRDAYFVRCDKTTTTQNDINKGVVNIAVGFAPLKPAEFVVLRLTQIAGQIQT
jgi:phage tail sheath protein FI